MTMLFVFACIACLTLIMSCGPSTFDVMESCADLGAEPLAAIDLLQRGMQVSRASKDSLQVGRSREAVVFGTGTLDSCRIKRIVALSKTSGPRDVFVLHDDCNLDIAAVNASFALHGAENVRVEPCVAQATGSWLSFDLPRDFPNMSLPPYPVKAAMIQWIASHEEYTHVWHVEDDVTFTGSWSTLFDASPIDADIVAKRKEGDGGLDNPDFRKWWIGKCRVRADQLCEPSAPPGKYTKVSYPLIRISRRFAIALSESFAQPDGASGFMEFITIPFCKSLPWCSVVDMPDSAMGGVYTLGRWGFYYNANPHTTLHGLVRDWKGEGASPVRDSIYHPIKCGSDHDYDPGEEQLRWSLRHLDKLESI